MAKDKNSKSEPATFVNDIEAIRKRARKHIEDGAVTGGYKGDRKTVIKILNEALATEIVCVLRYKRHHYTAKGIHSLAVAEEFLEHANEEQGHSDRIAERITQLDGYLANNDPTSRRMMEEILANEEEHAEEMKTLLEALGKHEGK
jgi:bacterioferritin